jgi:hypothetical protein
MDERYSSLSPVVKRKIPKVLIFFKPFIFAVKPGLGEMQTIREYGVKGFFD